MTQPIAICSNALADIGLQPIVSFEDGTTKAALCRDKFPSARDAVLALHPWNFATTYATLQAGPVGISLPFKWGYQYPLPVNPYCLHVFETDNDTDFEIGNDPTYGRVLWSKQAPPLQIKFAWRVEDTSLWSALATKVLEKWLAAELAHLSSAPRANKESLLKEAQGLIPSAERADAREGKPVRATPSTILLRSRHRWGGAGPGTWGTW